MGIEHQHLWFRCSEAMVANLRPSVVLRWLWVMDLVFFFFFFLKKKLPELKLDLKKLWILHFLILFVGMKKLWRWMIQSYNIHLCLICGYGLKICVWFSPFVVVVMVLKVCQHKSLTWGHGLQHGVCWVEREFAGVRKGGGGAGGGEIIKKEFIYNILIRF